MAGRPGRLTSSSLVVCSQGAFAWRLLPGSEFPDGAGRGLAALAEGGNYSQGSALAAEPLEGSFSYPDPVLPSAAAPGLAARRLEHFKVEMLWLSGQGGLF